MDKNAVPLLRVIWGCFYVRNGISQARKMSVSLKTESLSYVKPVASTAHEVMNGVGPFTFDAIARYNGSAQTLILNHLTHAP